MSNGKARKRKRTAKKKGSQVAKGEKSASGRSADGRFGLGNREAEGAVHTSGIDPRDPDAVRKLAEAGCEPEDILAYVGVKPTPAFYEAVRLGHARHKVEISLELKKRAMKGNVTALRETMEGWLPRYDPDGFDVDFDEAGLVERTHEALRAFSFRVDERRKARGEKPCEACGQWLPETKEDVDG